MKNVLTKRLIKYDLFLCSPKLEIGSFFIKKINIIDDSIRYYKFKICNDTWCLTTIQSPISYFLKTTIFHPIKKFPAVYINNLIYDDFIWENNKFKKIKIRKK